LLTAVTPNLQVFKREFTLWSCFSFALSISGLYPSILTTFSYPLIAGGGACAIWAWLLAGAGALSLALSSAEIASAYPTAGENVRRLRVAVYHVLTSP
jgi:amino acid transporter